MKTPFLFDEIVAFATKSIAPISCDALIVNAFQYSTRTLSTQSVLPTEPI